MTFWVGLSGGIGSGKSTVAADFAALNVPILSADEAAHALTAPNGAALPLIRAKWGERLFQPDQKLDRARLRQLVFNHPEQRRELEAILHPLIWQTLQQAQRRTDARHHYGIIEIPLLTEQPAFQKLVQQILIVEAPEEIRIRRIQQRSKLDEHTIRAIMSQQADTNARKTIATQMIHNNGNREQLRQHVMRLHCFYQALDMSSL